MTLESQTLIPRRSRFRRRATGKQVQITRNDLYGIFEPLHRYQYLRSRQLCALDGRYDVLHRLTDLFHGTEGRREHYLHKPDEQVPFVWLNGQNVYSLGEAAEAILRDCGIVPHTAEGYVSATRIGRTRNPRAIIPFRHALMISDIMVSIELGVRADPALRFISHLEILRSAPRQTQRADKPLAIPARIVHTLPDGTPIDEETHIEPDAHFGLEYTKPDGSKARRYFALEADRGTETEEPTRRLGTNSYLRKILGYREIVARQAYRTHLGIESLLVLNVTTSERRMRNIMALVGRIAHQGRSTMFLFKAVRDGGFDKVPDPTPRMLTEPWFRQGCEPLDISRPERKRR